MIKLDAGDIFRTAWNAQKAGVLELLPLMHGRIAPGERFFESIQSALLEYVDLERLDRKRCTVRLPRFAIWRMSSTGSPRRSPAGNYSGRRGISRKWASLRSGGAVCLFPAAEIATSSAIRQSW